MQMAAERERVQDVQERLNRLQFDAGTVDGRSGRQTETAIRAFQSSLNLPVTGVLTDDQHNQLVQLTETAPIDAAPPSGFETPEVRQATAAPLAPLDAPIAANSPEMSLGSASPLLPVSTLPPASLVEPLAPPASNPSAGFQPVAATLAPQGFTSSIFGIRPRDSISTAKSLLTKAGYSNCKSVERVVQCEGSANGMNDLVSVGSAGASGQETAFSVTRQLTFTAPRPRAEVVAQLQDVYPEIVSKPGYVEASGALCDPQTSVIPDSADGGMLRAVLAGHTEDAALGKLLASCDRHYSIILPAGEMIERMSIVLLDAAPLREQGERSGDTSATAQNRPNIRF